MYSTKSQSTKKQQIFFRILFVSTGLEQITIYTLPVQLSRKGRSKSCNLA